MRVGAWTKHHSPSQSRETRSDVDRSAACKIVDAKLIQPSRWVPLGVGQDVVDERGPTQQEQHRRPHASTLEHSTSQNHCGGCDESEAEASVQNVWNIRVRQRRVSKNIVQTCLRKVAEEYVCRMRLVQRIAVHPELDADSTSTEERLEDHSQCSLSSVHASVEKANGWGNLPT